MAISCPAVEDSGGVQRSGNEFEPTPSRPGLQPQGKQSRPPTSRLSSLSDLSASFRNFATEVNETHPVRKFNKLRVLCGKVVNHPHVQLLIISLIVVNALMMGVATFDFVTKNPAVEDAFDVTDTVFLTIFTVELCMQFVFTGINLFQDGWLAFDALIVVVSWSFNQEGMQVIRAFRIFRTLRLINRIETMRNLVTALFDIMPRLGAITALLLLIFYIFAVLFTQLFGDLKLTGDYFSRLDYSVLTLFIFMTMEWAEIGREVMAEIRWAWVPIVVFIMITGFIVFNLIIAVVCDAVAVIQNKEDLQYLMGFLGDRDGLEEGEAGGAVSCPAMNNNGAVQHEEELVENLAERISSVLNEQKDLLSVLDSLLNDPLFHMPDTGKQRENIHTRSVEEDEMRKGRFWECS